MLLSEQDPTRIAGVADAIKQAIRAPINFAKREIVLTASIGLITWTNSQTTAEDMVKDAELAMHQAKRFGGDRIEPFRPAFRTVGTDRLQLESDLRRAIERKEFTLAYQPIVRLEDGTRRRLRGAAAVGTSAPRHPSRPPTSSRWPRAAA
jgi:predicted signal transduction protein with EAL and GGDEF domain